MGWNLGSRLSKKLVAAIILTSSGVTLVVTIAQLAFDFHQDVGLIEQNLELIRTTHLSSVSKMVWDMDESQLKVQLSGLLTIPGIEYVEIADQGKVVLRTGVNRTDGHFLNREFPLEFNNDGQVETLGTIRIRASLGQIYSKIYRKIFVIFFTQFLKTLLVSTLIYILINRLIIKNLFEVVNYLKRFDPNTPPEAFALTRTKTQLSRADEFDVLAESVNNMRENLLASRAALTRLNDSLEQKVKANTQLILEQRQKLENTAKLSALGEMAGGIAHEINTPLAIIALKADQLRECAEEGDTQQSDFTDGLSLIKETADRIAKIVLGLKFFAREGSGSAMQKVRISTIIEDTLSFCQKRVESHGVRLELESNSSPAEELECRAIEISQVILNLLNNAFDAVQMVEKKWIRINVAVTANTVGIEISDSGTGIPKEIREKIMQPFFTTKEVGKGTGLGLSISKGIVERHGGTLCLDENSPYTRFVITLPKTQNVMRAA